MLPVVPGRGDLPCRWSLLMALWGMAAPNGASPRAGGLEVLHSRWLLPMERRRGTAAPKRRGPTGYGDGASYPIGGRGWSWESCPVGGRFLWSAFGGLQPHSAWPY